MDAGVPDYRRPEDNPGYAFIKDPDGHEIELVERDFGARWSIDHTMLRVEDADATIGFWTRAFEYDEVGRWEAPPEAMSLELTYNYDDRTYTMGDGWATCVSASRTSTKTGKSSCSERLHRTEIQARVTINTPSRRHQTATRSNCSDATTTSTRCSRFEPAGSHTCWPLTWPDWFDGATTTDPAGPADVIGRVDRKHSTPPRLVPLWTVDPSS